MVFGILDYGGCVRVTFAVVSFTVLTSAVLTFAVESAAITSAVITFAVVNCSYGFLITQKDHLLV